MMAGLAGPVAPRLEDPPIMPQANPAADGNASDSVESYESNATNNPHHRGKAIGAMEPGSTFALDSFARLVFEDGTFHMNSFEVVIGRDMAALRQARALKKARDAAQEAHALREGFVPDGSNGLSGANTFADPSSNNLQIFAGGIHQIPGFGSFDDLGEFSAPVGRAEQLADEADRPQYSQSYYSEKGGFLGPSGPATWQGDTKPPSATSDSNSVSGGVGGSASASAAAATAGSTGAGTGGVSGAASGTGEKASGSAGAEQQGANSDSQKRSETPHQGQTVSDHLIPHREYISHTPDAAAVNAIQHMPRPTQSVFVGIHCPGDLDQMISNTQAISRIHMKIKFNSKLGVFQAHPIHNNGFFIDDVHYNVKPVTLRSGDVVQIKDIMFKFFISGTQLGLSGSPEYDMKVGLKPLRKPKKVKGNKEMSFVFEDRHGDSGDARDTTSDDQAKADGSDSDNEHPKKREERDIPASVSLGESLPWTALSGDTVNTNSTQAFAQPSQVLMAAAASLAAAGSALESLEMPPMPHMPQDLAPNESLLSTGGVPLAPAPAMPPPPGASIAPSAIMGGTTNPTGMPMPAGDTAAAAVGPAMATNMYATPSVEMQMTGMEHETSENTMHTQGTPAPKKPAQDSPEFQEMIAKSMEIMQRYVKKSTEDIAEKKRGPGRPPKLGLFSVREMRQILEYPNITPEERQHVQATIQAVRQKNRKPSSKESKLSKEAKEAKNAKRSQTDQMQMQHMQRQLLSNAPGSEMHPEHQLHHLQQMQHQQQHQAQHQQQFQQQMDWQSHMQMQQQGDSSMHDAPGHAPAQLALGQRPEQQHNSGHAQQQHDPAPHEGGDNMVESMLLEHLTAELAGDPGYSGSGNGASVSNNNAGSNGANVEGGTNTAGHDTTMYEQHAQAQNLPHAGAHAAGANSQTDEAGQMLKYLTTFGDDQGVPGGGRADGGVVYGSANETQGGADGHMAGGTMEMGADGANMGMPLGMMPPTPTQANAGLMSMPGTPGVAEDGTPLKRKVGRPRKHPLPEGAEDRNGDKRKYKHRKSRDEDGMGDDGLGIANSIEGDGSYIGDGGMIVGGGGGAVGSVTGDGRQDSSSTIGRARANSGAGRSNSQEKTSEKDKRMERHKTPPLHLNRKDYTEEQVAKPGKNYSILIDEILREAEPCGLTLRQIYKRIQIKYPYFYFSVETKGWESSVRHNLIGNDAFYKPKNSNLWYRTGVELDAGKKRKGGSPERIMQGNHFQNFGTPQAGWPPQQQQQHFQHMQLQQHPQMQLQQQQQMQQPQTQQQQFAVIDANGNAVQQGFPQQVQAQAQAQTQVTQQAQQVPQAQHTQQAPHGQQPLVPQLPQQPLPQQPTAFAQQQQQQQQQIAANAARPQFPTQQPQLAQQPQQGQQQPHASPAGGVTGAPTNPIALAQQQRLAQSAAPSAQAAGTSTPIAPGPPRLAQQPLQPQQASQMPSQGPPSAYRGPGAPVVGAVTPNRVPMANQNQGQQVAPVAPAGQAPAAAGPAGSGAVSGAPPGAQGGTTSGSATPAPVARRAVSANLIHLVEHFKSQVMQQASELIEDTEETVMIVVNRGLGLSEMTVPGNQKIDDVLSEVFQQAKKKMGQALDPELLKELHAFKKEFKTIMSPVMDSNRSERLVLSAIDQVLGFTSRSMMHPSTETERQEMDKAESLLVNEADRVVKAYEKRL